MKRVYKAVIFDIDGTIYDNDLDYVSENTIKDIIKLHKMGKVVGICTGRAIHELQSVSRKILDLPFDFFITSGGSEAYDKAGKNIYRELLTSKQVELIKQSLFDLDVDFDIAYLDKQGNGIYRKLSEVGKYNIEWLKIKEPLIRESDDESITHMMLFANEEDHALIIPYLSDTSYFKTSPVSMDIYPTSINKLRGIGKILNRFNIALNETIAFGDGINDVTMLSGVGLGICLGNGCIEAKHSAKDICDTLFNDGVHKALVKYEVLLND